MAGVQGCWAQEAMKGTVSNESPVDLGDPGKEYTPFSRKRLSNEVEHKLWY